MTVRSVDHAALAAAEGPRRRDHPAPQRLLPLVPRRPGERDPARARARAARAPEPADRRAPRRAALLPCGAAPRPRRRQPPRDERVPPARDSRRRDPPGGGVREQHGRTGCRACSPATSTCAAEHLRELAGWSSLGPGIDHVLVRGLDVTALDGLAARAARRRGRGPLGSRAGRGDRRMTPAEARALFPVLERIAYLNAGTFGPLARPTLDAMQAELQADAERGRSGQAVLRARARPAGAGAGAARRASSAPSRSRSR